MREKIWVVITVLFILSQGSLWAKNNAAGTDIYPSNLEGNIYFDKYDDSSKMITGIHFMICADGSDSKKLVSHFKAALYLWVDGAENPIYVKTYDIDNLHQMGTVEFNDESVNLSQAEGLTSGTVYRLGIYVDKDQETDDPNRSNNAILFKGNIKYTDNSQDSQKNQSSSQNDQNDSENE